MYQVRSLFGWWECRIRNYHDFPSHPSSVIPATFFFKCVMKFNQQFTVLINFIEKSRNFRNFKLFISSNVLLKYFFYCRWRHDEITSWLKWRIVCTLHSSDLVFRIFIYFLHRICSELTRRPRIWSYNKWYLIGWWDDALIGWWYSIMRGRIWKAKSVPNYIGCFDSELILHKEKTLKGLL